MENLNVLARRHAGWSRAAVLGFVLIMVALWATGLTMHIWARDAVAEMPGWQESLLRGATVGHGTLTWAFCLLTGRWVWPHVTLVWHRRGHILIWLLGLLTLGAGGLMAVAGLGLLYGLADWHEALSTLHWWVGLGWPLLCAVHAMRWIRKRH